MNNKLILTIFILLTLSITTINGVMLILTIATFKQPVHNHYTYNVHNDYSVQNTTIKVIKKQVVVKQEVKAEEPKKVETTSGYSDGDVYLLAQLINAEAKGESFNGKVAVGNIVINRTKSDQFPDTIKGVIYQSGQFQPVSNGAINAKPSEESLKAARTAMNTNLIGNALYFYNPEIATDSWIRTRQVTTTIGNHSFAI